ncbi:WXG100 family type VII secretion target [Paenibacillus sp. OK076]|uniref:WXG100 family type VII secretion target n=1 Tax=Paenibacillus sp. OK076 TaxID=1884379 RepID=UPI0008C6A300|nr:WXG100 family type VII secretion target [Paenibacillus sp. OK076]SEO46494.1 WXG100 family type VII secretion target [Paenibacillus sp. OK076]
MSTIKVTPEQLHHVSNQVDQARQQLESIRNDLTRQIMFVQMMWMGATQERFYYEFEQSRPILDKALESMVNTSKELKDIATRFQDADAQKGSLGGAFGAVGAAAMMTKSSGDSNSGDKGYRMAQVNMFGKLVWMPVNENGVADQAALQAYQRDQGNLDFNRMQAVNVEPPGEDIFALQIKAFEMGIHPTTGEPVSDKYARMMVTSLKFSQVFMAIQMIRGSMPGRSGPFKTSSSGLASKIQNNIKKAESEAKLVNKPAEKTVEGTPSSPIVEDLSRAQQRNLTTLDNIVDKHLTEMDFSGTLRDLQGNPVPNKKTGGYWNHLQEMQDSYKGLSKIKRGLEGSLQNPNLSPSLKSTLEGALDKANTNLKKIEDLFEPFGGIK